MNHDSHVWAWKLELARGKMRGLPITDKRREWVDAASTDVRVTINRARSRMNLRQMRTVKP